MPAADVTRSSPNFERSSSERLDVKERKARRIAKTRLFGLDAFAVAEAVLGCVRAVSVRWQSGESG